MYLMEEHSCFGVDIFHNNSQRKTEGLEHEQAASFPSVGKECFYLEF